MDQIGAIQAILTSLRTKVDGSCSITLECNPEEIEVINKLMKLYLIDKRLFTVAFVQGDE
jgi:coproporphyrinogen III oxidase-like Fe-S oxidoreductase